MKYEMFSRVALKTNLPRHRLRRGDLATIVDCHQGWPGQEPGYSLEVFNAAGDTVDVITLRESQIEALTDKSVLHAPPFRRHAEFNLFFFANQEPLTAGGNGGIIPL
jgi:hypothetical protein